MQFGAARVVDHNGVHCIVPKTVHLSRTVLLITSDEDEFFNINPVVSIRYVEDKGIIYVSGWQPNGDQANRIQVSLS